MRLLIFTIFFAIFLSGCNSSTLPAETVTNTTVVSTENLAPSSLTYPTITASYFQNTAIVPNIPTISGDTTTMQYSIDPTLPLGLVLNQSTGVISGTPVNLMSQSFYTVKAKNSYGLVSITISIKVVIPPPSGLTYSGIVENQSFYNLTALPSEYSPTVTGQVDSYTIEPSLPTGMSFNTTTGVISGTPKLTDSTKLGIYNYYSIKAINTSGIAIYSLKFKLIDVMPSNLSYEVTDALYNVGVPISKNSPSYFGGTIALFVLDPVSLPAGLFFNSLTGDIQGTPLIEVADPVSYKITAYNTGGSVDTTIKIRVYSDKTLTLNYTNNNPIYTKDLAITSNTIIYTGGKPTSYTINPALPSGLKLDANTGAISGTPTVLLIDPQDFTITGKNTGGSISKTISIKVVDRLPAQVKYASDSYSIRKNENFSILPVGNVGGDVLSYAISPALPVGLSFNTLTGEISGTPSEVTSKRSFNITATNSGGSYAFSVNITVLPSPNYNISLNLIKKEFVSYNETSYLFELINYSKESDNSAGISLAMPITMTTANSNITSLAVSNNCFLKQQLAYLEKCQILFKYTNETVSPSTIQINVKASTVLTKTINLIDYLNISPANVSISGDRSMIEKAIVTTTDITIDKTQIASCNASTTQSCSMLPLATTLVSSENLPNLTDKALMQNANITASNDIMTINNDPDSNGVNATEIHMNLNFTSTITALASMNGYTSTCVVNPPYTVYATCNLGDFYLGSANINYSGQFSVNVGTAEGLTTEVTSSNSIPINVYKIKRIGTTDAAIRRIVAHNNKIYYTGLADSSNTTVKKLMEYNISTGLVRQVSNVNEGNDYAFPFASVDGLLFLKMRDPLTNTLAYFTYSDYYNAFNRLYTSSIFNAYSSSDDDIYYYYFNNKLFLPAKNQSINQMVSFEKQTGTLRSEFLSFYTSSNTDNGLINRKSLVEYNGNLYFEMSLKDSSTDKGKRLMQYNPLLNTQKIIAEKNLVSSLSTDDYLTEPYIYDNTIFYITRTADDATSVKADLYAFTDTDNKLKRLFSAEKEGSAEMFGVKFGKLFFKMPSLLNSDTNESLYYYDAITSEIQVAFKTGKNEKIIKPAKYANFQELQVMPFIVQKTSGIKELYIMTKIDNDYVIKFVTTSSQVAIDESATMFSYNGNLIFNCGSDLSSICSYNDAKNSFSIIAEGLKINADANVPGTQKPAGLVFSNNRVYFSIGTTSVNSSIVPGVYELCTLSATGCSSN